MKNNKTTMWVGIAAVVAIIVIFAVSTYNGLAKKSQEVDAQWGQVDTVLQRRYDLIPNLVSSVKGSMKQEKDVFGDIAKARQNYNKADTTEDKVKASNKLDQSVGTLINVIQEDYPELKSNENVANLMTQLEGTENRISTERHRYNDKVGEFNKSIVTFPRNIFAGMFGFHAKEYFKADEGAKEAPKVDFEN